MKTIENTPLDIVLQYYECMLKKDFAMMKEFLHEGVTLISPMATVSGKKDVYQSAVKFANILNTIEFNESQTKDSKVMLFYTMHLKEPVGELRAAALFTISEEKIQKIELFYDPSSLFDKRSEIFTNTRT